MLVSLATAKAHLRVTDDSEDALIAIYVAAAEDQAMQLLGRTVYATAPELELDASGLLLNASVEAAILLIAGHLFANRENSVIGASVQALPMGAHALLQPHRAGMGV